MKKSITTLLFLSLSLNLCAQDNYMQRIIDQACDCVSKLPEAELNVESVGICLIGEAAKYPDELLRDYKINMTTIDRQGEELGRIIGAKMLAQCPETMQRLVNLNEEDEALQSFQIKGTVKQISDADFVVFTVQDQAGKLSKFYWLTFLVTNNDTLQFQYEKTIDKAVSITYVQQELFDPKLNEYRLFNVITEMNFLDAVE